MRWHIVFLVLSGVAMQYVGYQQNFEPKEHLYVLGASAFAVIISISRYPNAAVATIYSSSISSVTIGWVTTKAIERGDPTRWLEERLCTLETKIHGESTTETTWEAWATGSWCNEISQVRMITRASNAYRARIEAKRCLTVCRHAVASDYSRQHGFVTSVPAGQIPSADYCSSERSFHIGKCPANARHMPTDIFTPEYIPYALLDSWFCDLDTFEGNIPTDDGWNSTWEAWATGRWCTGIREIRTTQRAIDAYRLEIHDHRCYQVCIRPVANDKHKHVFIPSVPAGRLPGPEECGKGDYLGQCLKDVRYSVREFRTKDVNAVNASLVFE